MTKTKILSTLVLILICCSYNYKKTDHENPKPNGIWKQIGYGNIIEVKDSTIKVYDIAKQNCDLSYEEEILDFGKIKSWTKDTLTIQHGIDNWLFTRLDKLPELCNTPVKELKNDPKHNFNVFWNTFNEHYSSFEIKGIDWEKVYETYNSKITSNTTELELYMIFQEMITLLDDGHVKMEVPESIEEQYNDKVKQKKEKYSKLDEFELHEEIAKLYVDSLRNYNAGMIRYGLVNKNVGYIQINSMLMLADYNLQRDLNLMNFFNQYWEVAEKSKDEIQRQEEVDGIHKILNSIIKELKDARSYILDLRFNGGGKDGVALAILNHFSNTEKVAFTKKARLGSGFTKDQEIHIFPNNQNFTGNVYLLTSGRTASASEILVLASMQNPNFTRIGSTTEGIFSSTLDKKLPNGWEYELSNEVYQDLKGNNYENIGISPDFPLEYSTDKDIFFDQLFDDLKNKKDKAIELAIKLENKKTK
ncbi:S41 family peptidase [Aquimarina celericrescens]|uniref:S41 family peptidase n=1 Tax=Aquimarina celericrescens TaxID=1964542 RepID=A0ABW5AX42_9FLAO|nr:S41 family peptidase [Aquimarina celericrescens]